MYIKIDSTYGSITHFYHFFYGVMVPIILYSINKKKDKFIINDDLGPMLKILYELPLNILYKCNIGNRKRIFIKPLDNFKSKYDNNNHKKRINYSDVLLINQFFKNNLPFYISANKKYDVILIERTIDNKYKFMDYSHLTNNKNKLIKKLGTTSGKERRYINNHQELVKLLEKKFGNKFLNISLENLPLFYQYYLFSNAKLVIAQHGAALSNVIFMKKQSCVIEIIPKEKIIEGEDTFENLSKICNLRYLSIKTQNVNPNINIKTLDNIINKLL